MFLCPICKKELQICDKALKCESNHSFDYAKSGYINLLNPGKKNNAKAGDSKEMVRARTQFFECGAYLKILETLSSLVSEMKNDVIVDAGSGEGYYTHGIAKNHTGSLVLGFDMTKFGCEHGAKVAKSQGLNSLHYAVSNIFDLPLRDSYADVILSVFAPVADKEFLRVLKSGGHLIVASAGIDHLEGLKRAIYASFYPNEEKFLAYDGFELLKVENLKYEAKICGNETINSLFTMTPYYHRTSLEDKEKLSKLYEITTTIEVNFAVYKKI